MQISSLFVCLLLVCHQMRVNSYDRQYYQQMKQQNNGISDECLDDINCSYSDVKHSLSSELEAQQLIDCSKPHNCQTNTLKSKRQQQTPNDCQNTIDCQDSNGSQHSSHQTVHKRLSHRHKTNQMNRHKIEEPSPQLISMTAVQEWNCNFDTNDCGIHNQYNMGSYFLPMPDTADPVLGRKGLLYLDLSRAQSAGARLITPYFPTNGCRYGCLTIEYILCGKSIENLYLIQQDVRNYCIWQKRNDHSYRWTTTSMTIDLRQGEPRFFIEVRFNPHLNRFGFVGISDMKFKYGECDRNEANECDLNQFVGTLL